MDGKQHIPSPDGTVLWAAESHLDADKVDGNDGLLQRGQVGLIQRLPHHHLGGHVDEVHADGLRHEGEGARRPQVALDHLQGQPKQTKGKKAKKKRYKKKTMSP